MPHRDQIVFALLKGRCGGLHGLIDKTADEGRACIDVASLAVKPGDLALWESDAEWLQAEGVAQAAS